MKTNDVFSLLSGMENSFLGYDNTFRHLERAAGAGLNSGGYPPYNIIRKGQYYRIEMAVAGFEDHEVDVNFDDGVLSITGRKQPIEDSETEEEVLFSGIAYRSFERRFTLSETMRVDNAEMVNGILQVHLTNVIPEHRLPRKIEVKTSEKQLLNE